MLTYSGLPWRSCVLPGSFMSPGIQMHTELRQLPWISAALYGCRRQGKCRFLQAASLLNSTDGKTRSWGCGSSLGDSWSPALSAKPHGSKYVYQASWGETPSPQQSNERKILSSCSIVPATLPKERWDLICRDTLQGRRLRPEQLRFTELRLPLQSREPTRRSAGSSLRTSLLLCTEQELAPSFPSLQKDLVLVMLHLVARNMKATLLLRQETA